MNNSLMEPNPVFVKAMDNYRIYLKFEDGKEKIYDMTDLIKNNQVYSKLETVEWPNGEDVCPENLYYDAIDI